MENGKSGGVSLSHPAPGVNLAVESWAGITLHRLSPERSGTQT